MTRERSSSGGSLAISSTGAATLFSPVRSGLDATASLPWDDWFKHASPAQKAQVLDLAVRQGVVLAHQLPPISTNGKPAEPRETHASVEIIARVAAGNPDELPYVEACKLTWIDEGLDSLQRHAVSQALATPDLFLLRGLPGTGKSRVLAEIITQAALQGQRILFIAPGGAALDVVLGRLAGRDAVFALRFLEPGESPSAAAFPCAYPERLRNFQSEVLQKARQGRTDAEERCRRRRLEEVSWPTLRELASKSVPLQERLAVVRRDLAEAENQVRREAVAVDGVSLCPLAAELLQMDRHQREALTKLDEEDCAIQGELGRQVEEKRQVDSARQTILPLVEARSKNRWWTANWWKAFFRGSVLGELSELERRLSAANDRLAVLQHKLETLRTSRRLREEQGRAERDTLIHAEIERRRGLLQREESDRLAEQQGLEEAWRRTVEALDEPARPAAMSAGAVEDAFARWQELTRRDEEVADFARRWNEYVDGPGTSLSARLPSWANLLAGTTTALEKDAAFAAATTAPVDLLIIEEADRLTEAEFLKLARHARRWLLVSDGLDLVAESPPARVNGPADLRPRCFQKLWQTLHSDTPRLHLAWGSRMAEQATQRLRCQFRPVAPEDRKYLEIERLVDFPEVELGILVIPKAPPLLAEVVFPAGMTIIQAKEFIFRELQEPAVQSFLNGGWLEEKADGFLFHLSLPERAETGHVSLELDRGVREWVDPASSKTLRLEFLKEAGWTRPAVDAFLQRHLHVRQHGRTALLQTAYRYGSSLPLTQVMGAVVTDAPYVHAPAAQDAAGIEFHAAPPPASRKDKVNGKRAETSDPGSSWPREGAGLEQDLANVRLGDRVPSDLRGELPKRGIVNYLEAQALVRVLESSVRASSADPLESIAVIALQGAQADLLRRLVARSEPLRGRSIEIGVPSDFRQREFDTVFVSLTRSHPHRAVPYGERESDLPLALTRARRRLVLFGDVGALVKRRGWQGPLDHLDAAASQREANRIAALLHHIRKVFDAGPA